MTGRRKPCLTASGQEPCSDHEWVYRIYPFGCESKGIRSLIVMNMPVKYDIDSTRFEDLGQKAHLLIAKVSLGGIEAGVMEGDKSPRAGLRS